MVGFARPLQGGNARLRKGVSNQLGARRERWEGEGVRTSSNEHRGKGGGAHETRVTSVPLLGTHQLAVTPPAIPGFGALGAGARRPRSLQIEIERKSPIVVDGFPVRRNAGRASERPDRPDAGGDRGRACSTEAETAPRARREQAVRVDDRSSGHDPRSGSRCPGDLESRSHLDSPGARTIGVMLRSDGSRG